MKYLSVVALLTMLALVCDNRNGLINPRNNPYDSGGDDFSISGAPSVNGEAESLWYDYNFKSKSGSIKLSYTVNDPNFPNDTVECSFLIHDDTIATYVHTAESDSFIIIPGLSPSTTYSCSILVTDKFDSSNSMVIEISTPLLLPPRAPEPVLTNDDNPVVIKWDTVASAEEYAVYGAENKGGPYQVDTIIEQPSDPSVTFSRNFNENDSRYYIVSAKNDGGENHSRDTLYARLYSNDVPVPKIDSVSKGTYTDFIKVTWKPVNNAISTYALYRSEYADSLYTMVTTVNNVKSVYSYNDSVNVPMVYYYKLASIDKDDQSSKLSEPRSGYIYYNRTPISLTVKGNKSFIELYWTPVIGVAKYVIYRSSTSCQDNLERIASTSEFNYFDTVTSSNTFLYTVVGLDSAQKEIAKSECTSGALGQLPSPDGIQITNTATSSVLRWDSVPGATKYIVYRSLDSCRTSNIDNFIFSTITATTFKDTVNISQNRYYRLAAVDNASRKGVPSDCYTGSSSILSSPTGLAVSKGTYPATVTLQWNKLDGAKSYVIYRSSTSCTDQKKLVSITSTAYTDSVPSSSSYYYSVSGVDASGAEGSRSECMEGRVKLLPAPTNVTGSYNVYTAYIKITWTSIPDPVQGYIVYRGTTAMESAMSPIDTVNALTCLDTVNDSRIFYYRVAAYNKLGPGALSQYTNGRTLIPPTLTIYNSFENIQISWMLSKTYLMAYIYRSEDSLTFTCIDSVASINYYYDTPSNYKRYYYRADLRTETGELVSSNVLPGYRNIAAPQNLKATDYKDRVYLTWEPVPGAQSYIVHRRTSSYGEDEFTQETTATDYFDTSISMKRYYYYVTAKNSNGVSAPSNQVQAGMLQTPGVPLIYLSGTTGYIGIYITTSSSGSIPNGFQIYRSLTFDGPYSLIDSTHEEYYFDSVPDFKTYYYRVTAYNNGGTSSFSEIAYGARVPPSPPSGVRASNGISTKFIRITWYPSDESISGYTIYRRIPSTSTYEKIASTIDTIFYDSTIGEYYSTVYYYVTTYIDSVESKPSSTSYGVLFGPPGSVGVSSTLYGINLSWTNRNNAEKYYIYRSGTSDGTFTLIDSSYQSSYSDTNELAGSNYYKVVAVSSLNGEVSAQSKSSAAATRLYPTAPYTVTATLDADSAVVKVTWSEVAGATGYKLFRSTADTFTANNSVMIEETDSAIFLDTVPSDSVYFYRLKAFNKGGESSLSTSKGRGFRISKSVPAKPVDFDTIAYSGSIYLQWKMPARTIAYTGFKVYRSEDDSIYTLVTTISNYTQTYLIDNPPKSDPSVYYYKVTAVNRKGESARTEAVSGTRK
jgi:fibronectin type 3 domain-containing protein